MDIISHGLWGGITVGRKSRKSFWLAFLIGIAPDIFSFGIFFLIILFSGVRPRFTAGPPDPSLIPPYVDQLYNFTHSLFIFAFVFILFWAIFKKPIWEIGAWGIHILMDIFSHSYKFFPTPFLWPFSNFKVDGISWGEPIIFLPNLILLAIFYVWFFVFKNPPLEGERMGLRKRIDQIDV